MTSIVKLHVFSGAQDESPPCYLLQVDEFKFLLDCGWDEDFNMHFIKVLKRYVNQIDAVLLSYPDHLHLGALPYMVGKCDLKCPIYATVPVYKMGQMFMYDLYQSRHNAEDFDIFTLDDVDAAFDRIQQLKYSQTVALKGKGQGLQITPLPAGHMLGGTIWKIVKDGEEEIFYAVDYNHKRERHLSGCVLDNISRPSLLITDAFNALYNQAKRRARDEQLMTTVLQTMRKDGNVLVAVDTAGRMLELTQLLDQMWRNPDSGLTTYSLALLNNVSFNVVEFAKSQVEWMSDKIMRAFEDNRNNPFHFKHIKLCHNLGELARVPEPKVVLASTPDLQSGYSRDLFVAWCSQPQNSIVLTAKTAPRTLARWLIDNPEARTVTLEVRRRVKLSGHELEEHQRRKAEEDGEEVRHKAHNLVQDESSEESEEELEAETGLGGAAKGRHDLMIKAEGKTKSGFFKQAKKAYPMFPFTEEKLKWDEYGEIIKAEDYAIAEPVAAEEEKAPKEVEPMEEEEAVRDQGDVPTKCVSSTVTLDINAQVQYIDFEGRSDGDAIRRYLSSVKPHQLVLIHGTEEATSTLAEFCATTGAVAANNIYCPTVGDTVDATTERHIYQVRLRDHLVSSLQFSKARDMELAWVDGCVTMEKDRRDLDGNDKDVGVDDDDETKPMSDVVPTLEPLPPAQIPPHVAVFVNEPKLSDFKQALLKAGIQCEFAAGLLICNNLVAVRREAGRIQVEGALCEDYFKVRELLYQQYAIV